MFYSVEEARASLASEIQARVDKFVGGLASQQALTMIAAEAARQRRDFLSRNPFFSEDGDVQVFSEVGFVTIRAEIISDEDRQRRVAREQLIRELQEETARQEAERERRYRHMLRNLKRLQKRIPTSKLAPGVASIWESLNPGQQYAILKDIDYQARHMSQDRHERK